MRKILTLFAVCLAGIAQAQSAPPDCNRHCLLSILTTYTEALAADNERLSRAVGASPMEPESCSIARLEAENERLRRAVVAAIDSAEGDVGANGVRSRQVELAQLLAASASPTATANCGGTTGVTCAATIAVQ